MSCATNAKTRNNLNKQRRVQRSVSILANDCVPDCVHSSFPCVVPVYNVAKFSTRSWRWGGFLLRASTCVKASSKNIALNHFNLQFNGVLGSGYQPTRREKACRCRSAYNWSCCLHSKKSAPGNQRNLWAKGRQDSCRRSVQTLEHIKSAFHLQSLCFHGNDSSQNYPSWIPKRHRSSRTAIGTSVYHDRIQTVGYSPCWYW